MKAHNKEKYVNVDELSQPQLIMQHFRTFDLDKNGKIDGLEILKAAANMNGKFCQKTFLYYKLDFIMFPYRGACP